MASPTPAAALVPELSFNDIINYEGFMDALLAFMNEAAHTILQVKRRTGLSPACVAPVKMNAADKEKKMNDIVGNLSIKYQEEASILNNSFNENSSKMCTPDTCVQLNSVNKTAKPQPPAVPPGSESASRNRGDPSPGVKFNVPTTAQSHVMTAAPPNSLSPIVPRSLRMPGPEIGSSRSGGALNRPVMQPMMLNSPSNYRPAARTQSPTARCVTFPVPTQARPMSSRGLSYPASPQARPSPRGPVGDWGRGVPSVNSRTFNNPSNSASGAWNQGCSDNCSNRGRCQQYR